VPLDEITRDHITGYLAGLGAATPDRPARSTATIDTYYRALRRFYNWAESRELVSRTPLRSVERPQVASKLTEVLANDAIAALVKACKGKDARSRRDEAMIRILAETGPRASELCGLMLADVDIYSDHLLMRQGKWARDRLVPFGNNTGSAISAWLRARPKGTGSEAVWLAERAPHAPVTRSGVAQMLAYRCGLAGLPKIHPHQLRHTAVSRTGIGRVAKTAGGWPDLVIAGSRGVLFRELKTEEGYASAEQARWLWLLHRAGLSGGIWRPTHLHSGVIARELAAIA
jgi:site-specific recombinase XerD